VPAARAGSTPQPLLRVKGVVAESEAKSGITARNLEVTDEIMVAIMIAIINQTFANINTVILLDPAFQPSAFSPQPSALSFLAKLF
jgi:hypothetical protein